MIRERGTRVARSRHGGPRQTGNGESGQVPGTGGTNAGIPSRVPPREPDAKAQP